MDLNPYVSPIYPAEQPPAVKPPRNRWWLSVASLGILWACIIANVSSAVWLQISRHKLEDEQSETEGLNNHLDHLAGEIEKILRDLEVGDNVQTQP